VEPSARNVQTGRREPIAVAVIPPKRRIDSGSITVSASTSAQMPNGLSVVVNHSDPETESWGGEPHGDPLPYTET
jgi:hypothetical protein